MFHSSSVKNIGRLQNNFIRNKNTINSILSTNLIQTCMIRFVLLLLKYMNKLSIDNMLKQVTASLSSTS